jgi:uncharacterized protein YkwD
MSTVRRIPLLGAALCSLLLACARQPRTDSVPGADSGARTERAPGRPAEDSRARPAAREVPKLPTPSSATSRMALTIADSIVRLTNRERTRADLPSLVPNAALTRAAQIQAEQMAAADRLAHEIPSARYPTLAARLKTVNYVPRASAENIAEGYTSAAAAVAGWMTSTGHRQNILSDRYTEIGVGTARSKRGRAFHAQVFGRRR